MEVNEALKAFLFTITQHNLKSIFKKIDPLSAKIREMMDYELNKNNFTISIFFSDKYIHRGNLDIQKGTYCGKEYLINLMTANGFDYKRKKFIESVNHILDILDDSEEYISAIGVNDLIFAIKYLQINSYYEDCENKIETETDYKILYEDFRNKFYVKLNNYIKKKNFSESEKKAMYYIIDDYLRNLFNGGIRQSPAELMRTYYHGEDKKRFFNKTEYCLNLLVNELTIKLSKGTKIAQTK